MAGRHSLLAVVLFAVILHAIAIAQTISARAGWPEVHPDRASVSDAALGRRRSRVRCAPPLPRPDRGRRARGGRFHRPWARRVANGGADRGRDRVGRADLPDLRPDPGHCFDRRIACLAAALAALLPRAAELGHDTLSDSLGLMCTFLALWLAAIGLRGTTCGLHLAAGLTAGARLSGAARGDSRPVRDRAGLAGGIRS